MTRSAKHDGSRQDLERDALLAARTLIDRMTRMYRELERLTGAPIALHRALTCIGAEPGLPASQLATALGLKRPAVSHLLKSLAARGWIKRVRSAEDQRQVRLYPTERGGQILSMTSGKAVGTLQRSVRRLSDQELRGVATGLDAILRHLPELRRTPGAAPGVAKTPRRRLALKAIVPGEQER